YALRMRPGLPVYDNFGFKNVTEGLDAIANTACYLAVGATRQYTTGCLAQLAGGALRVIAGWVREGDPGSVLGDLLSDARLEAGGPVQVFAEPQHWHTYDTV